MGQSRDEVQSRSQEVRAQASNVASLKEFEKSFIQGEFSETKKAESFLTCLCSLSHPSIKNYLS
jgi:hypothetical protein